MRGLETRDRERAAAALNELVRRNADLGTDWRQMARIAGAVGEAGVACEAARRMMAAAGPDDYQMQLAAAGILAEQGRIEEALNMIVPLAEKAPEQAAAHQFIGTGRALLGDNAGAIESLRRALKIWPNSGHTWLTLSALKKFSADDPDLAEMQEMRASMVSTAPEVHGPFLYALGKALDDAGQVDDAFAAFAEGAALVKHTRPYEPAGPRRLAESIAAGYDAKTVKALQEGGMSSNRPIFVTGWPRTGTTLVEQILVSHSQVADGAELNLFRTASIEVGGDLPADVRAYAAKMGGQEAAWSRIGETYLHLLDERFGPAEETGGRIVDKTLNNGWALGLIHSVFPKAPVVWLRRDPADAAWSCFRTYFNVSLNWSWSLETIAEAFMVEDILFTHWSRVMPETVLAIPYEELVSEPKTWIPRILAHCDLAEEEGVYAFHKTRRAITTSSVAQVRNPLNKGPIGSAKRYAKYLKPFTDIYKPPGA